MSPDRTASLSVFSADSIRPSESIMGQYELWAIKLDWIGILSATGNELDARSTAQAILDTPKSQRRSFARGILYAINLNRNNTAFSAPTVNHARAAIDYLALGAGLARQ